MIRETSVVAGGDAPALIGVKAFAAMTPEAPDTRSTCDDCGTTYRGELDGETCIHCRPNGVSWLEAQR